MGMRIRSRVGQGEETGATLVIVAIMLVALLGMLVLVLDVGGLLLKRRYMVQSADAAALAAAESCAVGANTVIGNPGQPAGDPKTEALKYAQGQRSTPDTTVLPGTGADAGGIVESATVGCQTQPAGHVSVSYTTQQSLFFAGIFGYGPSSAVGARSTAEWVPGGAANPVPFAIQVGSFQSGNCDVPNAPIGTICHFWEDNGGGGAGGFGGSSFGYVDTNPNAWNVNPNVCPINSNKGSLTGYAGAGGYNGTTPLPALNYPAITWVCGTNGLTDPTFQALWDYHVAHPQDLFAFPVVDGPPNIKTQGSFVSAWNVIGFVKMKLLDICRAKQNNCLSGDTLGGGSGTCQYSVAPSFSGSLDLDLGTGAGQTGSCPNTAANVDSLTGLTLTGCGQANGSPCSLGTDYTYDTVNHVITFIGPARSQNVTIDFNWQIYGKCGQPASNASGYCFVLQWEGIQLGNAPGGKNFGIDTVRLCDVAIVNSCKSLTAGP